MASHTIAQVLENLLSGKHMNEAATIGALDGLLTSGDVAQMSAFLVLLRAKGETAEEVAGLAKAMLARAVPVHTDGNGTINNSS